ncbi:probable exported protein STY0357 [hydrothermal vent metagenome]|uniref:Probable exported protein STY0357 n=1 Tax=hydrothermal vent metagenome TaxID=652676 RepID=A0A1W1BS24_9ZZZZ
MKKVFLLFIILFIGILSDISMEFKDIIVPKVQKEIIEPILAIFPKKEVEKVVRVEKVEENKIIKIIRDKKEKINLSHIKPIIDTQIKPLCPLNRDVNECLPIDNMKIGNHIFIRIFKLSAELEVWIKDEDYYQLLKIYPICKQSGNLGPKLKEGDLQGVEGFYQITEKSLNPNSKYNLSFNLGYPNKYDKIHKRTGSALMVHGGCKSVGCYAIGDDYIEELYGLLEDTFDSGQKRIDINIFPFRMSDKIMLEYSDNEWYNFWGNLKEGYDYFEETGVPPKIEVVNRRYELKL